MKKVVQFIASSSIYNDHLQEELMKCSSFSERYENFCINLDEEMKKYEKLKGISSYSGLGKASKALYWAGMNRFLKKEYGTLKGSIVNIQYVSVFFVMLLPFLNATFSRIVISFWGSDILRQNRIILKILTLLISRADVITLQTPELVKIFGNKMGRKYDSKIRIVRFGNPFLDDIDSMDDAVVSRFTEKYGIDTNRTVVVAGYNRTRGQQHLAVAKSLKQYNVDRIRIFIVIPWTSGPCDDADAYRKEIEDILKDDYDYLFITEYLSDEELVALRKATDVLIQVQITDSMSASMEESLYAKKEVITGEWLPYKDLYDLGLTMRKAPSADAVGKVLNELLASPMDKEALELNSKIIGSRYRWKDTVYDWVACYQDEEC
ncbi:MAG: hypothetical protein K6F73_05430 [Lachnospiraceae bacterium]|nr:hypothetical protein [Lachnospiraceae bacterium]